MRQAVCCLLVICAYWLCAPDISAQKLERSLSVPATAEIVIANRNGRVTVKADDEAVKNASLQATTPGRAVTDAEIITGAKGNTFSITVKPAQERDRIDLTVTLPPRARVRITTEAGAVDVIGAFTLAQVFTETATISAQTPFDEEHAVKLEWLWQASRPRYFSEEKLPPVKEKNAGTFLLQGQLGPAKPEKDKLTELKFVTERGVVLFNVEPALVPTDLRERALTKAAKLFIGSGNEDLSEAVRMVSPNMFGAYTKGLPPPRGAAPTLVNRSRASGDGNEAAGTPNLLRLNVSLTDMRGRAVPGLTAADFVITENGQECPVKSLETTSAPFNLVLLLDVSGSVESRIDFIRKAARDFLKVAGANDSISIVSFHEDIQLLSDFTPDRRKLFDSLHEIEAGGATALYDALAYALVQQLKPLHGERSAVVIMSDGDDNRSFLPFGKVLPLVYESGALIYPLYMPSGLLPENSVARPETTIDPMRARYLTLTTRAEQEGRELARISGGVYYPIAQLPDLQAAYEDVVAQLRTAYTLTYESPGGDPKKARPHVEVRRPNVAVRISSLVSAGK